MAIVDLSVLFPKSMQDREPFAVPHPIQLENMKTQLDLTLLALEALAGISSEAMLQAAAELGVLEQISDRVSLWRLRQSSPLRNGQGGRKKLDIEEARSLVTLVGHLAQEHQEVIRRAVALLEQYADLGRPPHEAAFLGDYLDRFTQAYQERMTDSDRCGARGIEALALKLLLDLLFYSSPDGARRLWVALFDRAWGGTAPPRSPSTRRPSRSRHLRKPL